MKLILKKGKFTIRELRRGKFIKIKNEWLVKLKILISKSYEEKKIGNKDRFNGTQI
jgi:hypothetical protein